MASKRQPVIAVPGVPRTFRLAALTWTVQFVSKEQQPENLGETHLNSLTITIRNDLPPELTRATFWHELLHAVEYTRGRLENMHDEVQIDSYALLLHQFDTTRDDRG